MYNIWCIILGRCRCILLSHSGLISSSLVWRASIPLPFKRARDNSPFVHRCIGAFTWPVQYQPSRENLITLSTMVVIMQASTVLSKTPNTFAAKLWWVRMHTNYLVFRSFDEVHAAYVSWKCNSTIDLISLFSSFLFLCVWWKTTSVII